MSSLLQDGFGRSIDYLRLSVTDRCDFRCVYCMAEDMTFLPRQQVLTLEELERTARIFVAQGVRKIRLTGGEPLLRKGLENLVEQLAGLRTLEGSTPDLTLTTNGTQLGKQAHQLRAAGVRRLNISLDSLRGDCVKDITGTDCLPQVLEGIKTAKAAGFERIKINMVPLSGINDIDLDDMVAFCIENGFILNLIEAMPMGATGQAHAKVSLQPVLADLQQKFGLTPYEGKIGGGPARYWQSGSGDFTLGLITPMSQHFCASCNRVRLSATGNIHLCLGQEDKVPLRDLLRDGCSDAELEAAIRHAIMMKPEKHEFVESPHKIIRVMALTGG